LTNHGAQPTQSQTCNIAFVKTHKTASTTMATILYRYAKRHDFVIANFTDHHTTIPLEEAVEQVTKSGRRVDLMHYHYAWNGYYKGTWAEAEESYAQIMTDPSRINFVTVLREPVSHFLSYYYYFIQPSNGLSIAEYIELHRGLENTHILYNPLSAEFGIRTIDELGMFIRDSLPHFKMVLLTEFFDESLALFMRMFNWDPIDMTYCR
ncbi:unnamed protein product, partial [Choristocarpus tenellus]